MDERMLLLNGFVLEQVNEKPKMFTALNNDTYMQRICPYKRNGIWYCYSRKIPKKLFDEYSKENFSPSFVKVREMASEESDDSIAIMSGLADLYENELPIIMNALADLYALVAESK